MDMDSHEEHASERQHEKKSEHHHAPKHEPKHSASAEGKNYSTILVGAAVVQVLLLLFIAVQINNFGSIAPTLVADVAGAAAVPTPTAAPSAAPVAAPAPNVDMKALIDDDAVKGDADAPVTIIEWSDFECPFCARFYEQTLSQIDEQYIKTGKVKLIYRDFPLGFHAQAQKAAEAAECAGEQGKYFDMHDALFEKGVQGGVASFKQFAATLGLDTTEFNSCLDSGKMASEVAKDMADGSAAGISGTPGFLINGQLVSGAQPFGVFQQIIEAELAS